MANRHGLIAGATGTGKTCTLQNMAETFSRMGVPVFATDIKGDLSKEGYTKVNDHFSFTENMERVVVDIFLKKIRPEDVKIFAGYSGWHAGQLEEELSRNYWKKAKTSVDFAALSSPDLWKDLMTSLGGEHLIWANTPKDTRMN